MNINLISKNLELTPAMEEHIGKKMAMVRRLVRNFEEKGAVDVNLEVSRTTRHHKKGNIYYAEANMLLDGHMIRAEETSDDVYKAVDSLKNLLKREISKHKDKIMQANK